MYSMLEIICVCGWFKERGAHSNRSLPRTPMTLMHKLQTNFYHEADCVLYYCLGIANFSYSFQSYNVIDLTADQNHSLYSQRTMAIVIYYYPHVRSIFEWFFMSTGIQYTQVRLLIIKSYEQFKRFKCIVYMS